MSVFFFDKSVKFLEIFKEVSPIYLYDDSVKVGKIIHVFVNLHRIVFTKVSLCLQINGKQNTTYQFSVKLFSNKNAKATFKLVLTQRQYVDRSY